MSQQSPLHEITRRSGAIYGEAAGWTLPTQFADWTAEYRATLDSVTIFDQSHHGKLEVSGPDAPSFLHNLSTNDINNLPLGGGCEAYFCDARAKVLAHALVYHVMIDGNRHGLWLDVTPGFGEKLLKHLDRHLIAEQVELTDHTMQFAQLHLAGPNAVNVLEKALGSAIPPLSEFLHMERNFGVEAVCHIRRHDVLGVPGFDLVCRNERAIGIWQMLCASGAHPAGSRAFEVLRIEAGTPQYGIDIDENRFVMEVANALRGVSYSKGCYLGQEPIVMARDRAGHVNRGFFGLKILGDTPLPQGTKLLRDGAEVGVVTSSIVSPRLGCPIALGYLRRGHQDRGTKLSGVLPTGNVDVEVLGYPP